MGKSWDDISEGVRVEVLNTDSGLPMKVYWIASIIKLAGKQIGTRTRTRPAVPRSSCLTVFSVLSSSSCRPVTSGSF